MIVFSWTYPHSEKADVVAAVGGSQLLQDSFRPDCAECSSLPTVAPLLMTIKKQIKLHLAFIINHVKSKTGEEDVVNLYHLYSISLCTRLLYLMDDSQDPRPWNCWADCAVWRKKAWYCLIGTKMRTNITKKFSTERSESALQAILHLSS